MPLKAAVVIPLMIRSEFRAHEKERLTRSRYGVANQRAKIRQTLPLITGHLAKQRALQVHHLIVRERIHEPFAVFVHHCKREFVVRPATEKGIDFEIVEGVVHPPHVPFHRESEPTLTDGMRHLGPRRTLLSHRDHARVQRLHRLIQLLEK